MGGSFIYTASVIFFVNYHVRGYLLHAVLINCHQVPIDKWTPLVEGLSFLFHALKVPLARGLTGMALKDQRNIGEHMAAH